jgi:putative membrane protein insertion efficiency factor
MKRYILLMILILYPVIYGAQAEQKSNFGPWDSKLIKSEKQNIPIKKEIPSTSSFFTTRFIRFFQIFISPQDGPNCRYSPTCSRYARISIDKYGPIMGTIMFSDRFLRCNPFGLYGHDHPEDNYFWDKKTL